MTSIRIPVFGGLGRAVTDRHLSPSGASTAHNTELRDGALRAFRAPLQVGCIGEDVATVVEIPEMGGACAAPLLLPYCARVTYPLDPGCRGFGHAVIWPENGDAPLRYFPVDGTYEPLIVPRPTLPPSAARTSTGTLEADINQSPDQRSYTYTWVDQFGIESPPAPPSPAVHSYDDETWAVTIPSITPPPPNAVCIRLYRTSASIGGARQGNLTKSSFQLVAEYEVTGTVPTLFDTYRLKDMQLGTLQTIADCAPPPGLCDVAETLSGYHVGFSGQVLHFSERNEPHNWPERYSVTLPFEIKALAVNGDIIYVGTAGNPFIVRTGPQLDDLTDEMILRVEPVPYDQKYPCIGRRTMVATAWGAIYVGREGLVALQPSVAARVATRNLIDEDLWLEMVPNRLMWLNGRLYAGRAPHGPGFILDVRGQPEGTKDLGELVTVDLTPADMHATSTGRLFFADGRCAYAWDEGRDRLTYKWKSKRFVHPGLVSFNAAKVVGSYGTPVTLRVICDETVIFEREVAHSRPFRLPHSQRGLEWRVELEGVTTVHEVHIATSMAELTELGQ